VGEVADYQIKQRIVFGERRYKDFKGFAKWTHKLQAERAQIIRVSFGGLFHRKKEKCIGI
jgi:hypothetical protein